MIYNYERLLRQVTYTNRKPAYYLNRQFKIACSELNGRFVSNEYVQTLTVIHPTMAEVMNDINEKDGKDTDNEENDDKNKKIAGKHVPSKISHRQMSIHGVPAGIAPNVYSLDDESWVLGLASRTHNNITAVIVVVCVAFVGVILVLGILRIRAAHKRTAREELQAEVEMAWDDSALNITVNPLEDDLGGLTETTGTGKGLVKRFGAVVGLNSNGKGSKGAYGACPTTTTTTISNTSELGSNDDEVENEEEGYMSSSDEEEEDDEDEYTDGDEDEDVDCCDDDCGEEEDEDDNDDNLDSTKGHRIIQRNGSGVEILGARGEREMHSMEWDNDI
jgi:preprotein translocase subunit SecG